MLRAQGGQDSPGTCLHGAFSPEGETDQSPDNDSPEWIVLGGGGTARGVKAMIVGLRQRGQDQDGGTWAEGSRSRWRHRERGQGWDEGGRGVCPSPEMALDSTL